MSGFRKIFRAFWVRLFLALVVGLGFTSIARLAYQNILINRNISQLEELNLRTLHRAEDLVDYAVESLADLQLSGLSSCDANALEIIREISFLRGSIKDIQVLNADHGLLCSGATLGRELGERNFDFSDAYSAQAEHIYFHDITKNNSGILGVARHVDAETTFLAVLNLDSLLFGVFPEQVRDYARADLIMGGNVEVASQFPTGSSSSDVLEFREFVATSERYPLSVVFNVDMATLGVWNNEIEKSIADMSLVVGLILGWLLLLVLGRPISFEQQMRDAMANGEFVGFLQPVFDVQTRDIVGCEVLMRWVKPDGEIVPPFRFIPAAEESGLIVPMTRVLIADTLEHLSGYLKENKKFKVAFNIVPADLVSDGFETEICDLSSEAGVARRQVVLEITERQEFFDQSVAIMRIKSLRNLGFRVALDDTGVGHNGLSNVQQLGADIIKIDKIFIDRVGVDKSATTIVQMLVRLAKELDMRTVAEGIETTEQLKALAACDVDEGQGYLVSKPVAPAQFERLLIDEAERLEHRKSKSHAA